MNDERRNTIALLLSRYPEDAEAECEQARAEYESMTDEELYYALETIRHEAGQEAQKDYNIAQANDISYQEGRSMNIMAACHLMNGNIDEGYFCFKKAYHIFKESGNHLFMWRPSFNIGQIYYKYGKISKALKHYQKFLKHEITNISERLPNLTLSNSEMVCLVYIARILRKNSKCKEADVLYEKYKTPCFEYYYNISDQEFETALSKLHYVHNGFIIILG